MAISLAKGSKVSLAKVATDAGLTGTPTKVMAGLGWDTNAFDSGGAFDLDASIFMCGANGKVLDAKRDFVFYGNLETVGVKHMGDNLTGAGDGDDEVVMLDLSVVDAAIEKIVFAVTIHEAESRGQNFGQVSNSYIRVIDQMSTTELLRYDLGEDFSIETAVTVGEFYRSNGEWKFNAIGAGFSGGLKALCGNYGVEIG